MQASCGTGVEERTCECRCCCLVVANRERVAALPAAFSAALFTGAEACTFFLRRENATASSTCSGAGVALIVMSTRAIRGSSFARTGLDCSRMLFGRMVSGGCSWRSRLNAKAKMTDMPKRLSATMESATLMGPALMGPALMGPALMWVQKVRQ